MNKPEYNFGDLVKVAGYFPRIFEVDGRRIEHWQYKGEEWVDIVYEVYDVMSADWIECCEDDITLVAEADKAEEYLEANPPDYEVSAPTLPDWAKDVMQSVKDIEEYERGAMNMAKQEPRKPTARELSAQLAKESKELRKKRAAEIDNLLDLRNWAADMLAKTGNEEFGDRIFALDAELKKLVETE
jgi:hypothetical protein